MVRVKPVNKATDYPGTPDAVTQAELAELFQYLFPDSENAEIDAAHLGIAVTAQNPALALNLAKMSGFIVRDMGWCQRHKLHELAVQTVNWHFNCRYSLRMRQPRARALGLGPEVLAAIADGQPSQLLDEEAQLVIDYTKAVISGRVPDALFSRVINQYGEKEAVECSAAIAWWSMWAMIINALCPDA